MFNFIYFLLTSFILFVIIAIQKGVCFMAITNKILNQVQQTIEKYNMFNYGDTVVIGVSGGADSVMLLHCLNQIKDKYNLHLIAAHVNHKIRPGDAENDAQFVKELCEKWGIEFHLREEDIKSLAKEMSMGEEEAGRFVRYGFFRDLCMDEDGNYIGKIATAHNANDNVETVLMRFMRGTGVQGLSGISYKRDNIVRPILGITRADIEAYIVENALTHITDKTNFESIYTRNKIRLELIPFMQNMFNPNLIETVTNNIQTYREDAEFIESLVDKSYKTNCWWNYEDRRCLNCSLTGLRSENVSIAKRVIIKAIKDVMGKEQTGISPQKIDEIYKGLNSEVGTIFVLSEKYEVLVDYDILVFKPTNLEKNMNEFTVESELQMDEISVHYPEFHLDLGYERVFKWEIDNNGREIYLPEEFVKGKTLTLRTRREGDIFRVFDNCHKKLNRVFVDKKVSKVGRDNKILLCDGNEVLWCVGEFATRFNIRSGRFVRICVE